jgi:hypothetical protein
MLFFYKDNWRTHGIHPYARSEWCILQGSAVVLLEVGTGEPFSVPPSFSDTKPTMRTYSGVDEIQDLDDVSVTLLQCNMRWIPPVERLGI